MRTLHTAASRPSDIVIGPGLLKEAGERSRRINRGVRVLLVSDSNVAPLYADTVAESYAAAGYRVTRFVFPAGEESKRLSTIAALYEQLAADGLTRADLILSLIHIYQHTAKTRESQGFPPKVTECLQPVDLDFAPHHNELDVEIAVKDQQIVVFARGNRCLLYTARCV